MYSLSHKALCEINMSRKHQEIVDVSLELLTQIMCGGGLMVTGEADIQTFLSAPGITTKEQLTGKLRNFTLRMTADRFSHEARAHVYT